MPSLLATLGLNTKSFERGLHDSKHAAKEAGKEIGEGLLSAGKGLIGGLAFEELIRGTIESAARIKELSELFHVSTDTIQIWDRAAARVGMTAEDVGSALMRLGKARETAIEKGDVGAFGKFGLTMEDLKNKANSTEDILNRMRAAAEGHPLTEEEDVAGMEMMGRSGAKILSVLEQINNLGPVHIMQKDDVENLHEAEIRLKEFRREMEVGAAMIASKVVPAADKTGSVMGGLMEWFSGRMSLNEAIGVMKGQEATPVAAPTVDLKGRKIEQHEEAKKEQETAEGTYYNVVKTVDLHKQDAEIAKLKAELEQKALDVAMKSMTVEQRRAALNAQIAEHKKKSIELRFGEGDEVGALKEDLEVERLKGDLASGQKRSNFKPDVNELQKIGAYTTAPGQTQIEIAARSEKHLEGIFKGVTEMVKETRKTRF